MLKQLPAFLLIAAGMFLWYSCNTSPSPEALTKAAIQEDLQFLSASLKQKGSYVGLNGYHPEAAFEAYLDTITTDKVDQLDFALFLDRVIGQIGDRHSSVKEIDLPNTLFLPFVVAPYNDQVIGVAYVDSNQTHNILFPNFPYLKSINGIPTKAFLQAILPDDVLAPPAAFLKRATKYLKYMERNYARMQKELPATFDFVFTNQEGQDTLLKLPLERERRKYFTWDDKFYEDAHPKGEELNDPAVVEPLFHIDEDNIAYLRIPDMLSPGEAPFYNKTLEEFMGKITATAGLIIDVRSNTGGTRHLIYELAPYFVHPDSIYVVNVAQQKGEMPLNADYKEDLNNRFLFSMDQLDEREQAAVDQFLTTFEPMYQLAEDKFSPYHFMVLNGQKLKHTGYLYPKPVYILINERTFSAASVLAAVFKGLPNIRLAGVTTDGSSGNSERDTLPNSGLIVKISTMVSFQKDGKILDGIGTAPDIEIPRNLDDIFWIKDNQLEAVKSIIKQEMAAN